MQPYFSRGTLRSALLIAATTGSTKADEVGERPVAIGGVPLQREVGAIELQQEAVRTIASYSTCRAAASASR